MEIGDLYNFVLLIVLVGFLVGAGVLALDKFTSASGVTAAAQTSINASRDAVGTMATVWLGLIVTIGALAIIIVLIVRSFGGAKR